MINRLIMVIGLVALIGIAALAPSTSSALERQSPPGSAFCADKLAVDYSLPLQSLPPVPRPPRSGRLWFEPERVTLYSVANGAIRSLGDYFGYALAVNGPDGPPLFNLEVRTEFRRMHRNGEEGPVIRERRRILKGRKNGDELDFSLRLSGGTGLFRYRIEFARPGGPHLATYAEYVRVLRPHFAPLLKLSKASYRVGEQVLLQVQNRGTIEMMYGSDVTVERLTDGEWMQNPFGNAPVQRRAALLSAGRASRCYQLQIPNQTLAGRYRVSIVASSRRSKHPRRVYASFDVVQ
jgi:hypothetical protein